MPLKSFGILAVSCALAACATTGHYTSKLNGLVGQPAETVLAQWGEPRGDVRLENGDRLLTYIRLRSIIVPGIPSVPTGPRSNSTFDNYTEGTHTDTIDLRCMTKFYIHDGLVQRWSVAGNDCISR